ncbi:hypothetical protein CsSME_00005470 [Camellia sinensis var. sinensis]
MMEGSDNWKLRPVNCFILCLFFSIQSALAQEVYSVVPIQILQIQLPELIG